jgi:hypothetical protein
MDTLEQLEMFERKAEQLRSLASTAQKLADELIDNIRAAIVKERLALQVASGPVQPRFCGSNKELANHAQTE